MIVIQLFLLLLQFKSTESANTVIAKPGCPETCEGSDILIPYPFGIGQNCSLSEEFVVNCENTTNGIPSPYRGLFMIEHIDLPYNQASTKLAIASSCGSTPTTTKFSNIAPFRLNTKDNKFVVVGCNTLAYLHLDNRSDYLAGCFSSCGSLDTLNNYGYSYRYFYQYNYRFPPYEICYGIGCCQTDIPKGTSTFYATFEERFINNSKVHDSSHCSYAMVVDLSMPNQHLVYSTISELANSKAPANQTMPIKLGWAIGNTTCEDAQTNKLSYACRSDHSDCFNSTSNSGGYSCSCKDGYEGNPYLDEGCQDIDECAYQNQCPKPGKCHNLPGTYQCSCFFGWSTNDDKQGCHLNVAIVIAGLDLKNSDIPELKGDNYKAWKEAVLLHLGCMDIDEAIRLDQPAVPELDEPAEIWDVWERWERSNRLCCNFIKSKLSAGIRGSVGQHQDVKDLLKALDEQFASSEKAHAMTLIMKLTQQRLTGVKGVRDHIMKMRDMVAQLKNLEVEITESFLVYFILNTLPVQYGPFKISYNTHKQIWSINELMAMCVQEENRLIMEQGESSHMAEHAAERSNKNKGPGNGKQSNKSNQKGKGKGSVPSKADIKNDMKCYFCKKKGHMKKDCMKYKAWLEKNDKKKEGVSGP